MFIFLNVLLCSSTRWSTFFTTTSSQWYYSKLNSNSYCCEIIHHLQLIHQHQVRHHRRLVRHTRRHQLVVRVHRLQPPSKHNKITSLNYLSSILTRTILKIGYGQPETTPQTRQYVQALRRKVRNFICYKKKVKHKLANRWKFIAS